MVRAGDNGAVVNEWLEGRLTLRDRDPAKYLRETSPALRATVEASERAKARASAPPEG